MNKIYSLDEHNSSEKKRGKTLRIESISVLNNVKRHEKSIAENIENIQSCNSSLTSKYHSNCITRKTVEEDDDAVQKSLQSK